MRTQRGERRGVQIVEPGTAVEQQGLAEHAPQPVLDAGAVAVSPPVEHLAGLPQRLLDGGFTEDQAGQVKSIERAQAVEVGEPAEQVGQGDHERPHRRLGRQRLRGHELRARWRRTAAPTPTASSPTSCGRCRRSAATRSPPRAHRRGGTGRRRRDAARPRPRPAARPAGPAHASAARVRRGMPTARLRRSPAGPSASSAAASLVEQRDPAVPAASHRQGARRPAAVRRRPARAVATAVMPRRPVRPRSGSGEHADPPARGSAPCEEFSFAARSRPDRWM